MAAKLKIFSGQRPAAISAAYRSNVYTGAKTVVRTVYGNSSCFEIKVGMHQGSALSPLLFVIVMEENLEWPYHGSCCMLMTWL